MDDLSASMEEISSPLLDLLSSTSDATLPSKIILPTIQAFSVQLSILLQLWLTLLELSC